MDTATESGKNATGSKMHEANKASDDTEEMCAMMQGFTVREKKPNTHMPYIS